MARHAMSDSQWEKIRHVIPQTRTGPVSKLGDRSFIDAVLYRAKTGIPWRDLPERFGPWKTVYNRFDNWAAAVGQGERDRGLASRKSIIEGVAGVCGAVVGGDEYVRYTWGDFSSVSGAAIDTRPDNHIPP